MIGAVLSGRIGGLLVGAVVERRDELFEVAGDLPVHLGHAGLPARASAAVISCRVCWWWVRCWGRNSAVVMKVGQVGQELACGQDCRIGRPQ